MEKTRDRFKSALADYFKEVIYGGIDGIITTFAVVSGAAGASLSNDSTSQVVFLSVLLFGLANLFADAASMGLGNFLSVRSEKDLYHAARESERHSVQTSPQQGFEATVRIMQERGFSEADATMLAEIYRKNEEYWLDFLMQHGRELSDPRGENEVFTGLATFLSFMVFGAIPLLPFMLALTDDASVTFLYSAVGTFVALVLLGLLKWRVIGARFTASLFEVVLVGGTAAVLAYFVGTFFSL